MKGFTSFCLVVSFAFAIGLTSENVLAQYTGEYVFCPGNPAACQPTDPTPDAATCRATAVPPGPDGVVVWDRAVLGNCVCAGVGITPQPADCNFSGASYLGFDCTGPVLNVFQAPVPAGLDMAIACSDTTPLPGGNYSARATDNDCGGGPSVCRNITTQN